MSSTLQKPTHSDTFYAAESLAVGRLGSAIEDLRIAYGLHKELIEESPNDEEKQARIRANNALNFTLYLLDALNEGRIRNGDYQKIVLYGRIENQPLVFTVDLDNGPLFMLEN